MKKHTRDVKAWMLWAVLAVSVGLVCNCPASAADKTIGVILTGDVPYYQNIHKAFLDGMASQGLGPEKVQVLVQTPAPDPMSWANAVRKFVAYDVDAIVCLGAPAALMAKKTTSKIPLVFAGVFDPDALDLTDGNVTGISSRVPIASVIKNLKSISNFSALGVIVSPSEKDTTLQADEVKKLEGRLGFHSVMLEIEVKEDVAKIAKVDALLFTTSAAAMSLIDPIMDVCRAGKIPTASVIGGEENKGVVLTVAADPHEQGSMAAKMAAKVIQGTKASTLPVEVPKKVAMVINLKEATALGQKVPFGLLTSAAHVIK